MAFCNNCGAELPEGGKFCTKCGTKVEIVPVAAPVPEVVAAPVQEPVENTVQTQENTAQENAGNQAQEQPPVYEMPQGMPQQVSYGMPQGAEQSSPYGMSQQPVKKEKKPVNKKLIIIIAAAALALIIIIIVAIVIANIIKTKKEIAAKTIKFTEEFLEVEYSGYDGFGEAVIYLDRDEFKPVAYKAMGYDEDSKSSKAADKFIDLIYGITIDVSETEALTNGQELTVKIIADQDEMEDVDVILKDVEFKLTVSGLEEVEKYNPFDDIKVSTSGLDGEVRASWEYVGSNDNLSTYSFDIDNSRNLSVGDTFTITLDDYYVESMLEYYGIMITETKKTYTVESADHYIATFEEISDSTLATMKKDAEEEIEESYDGNYLDVTLDSYEYYGAYVMKGIDDSWSTYDNVVYLIYKGVVTSDDGEFDAVDVYLPVRLYYVMERADGTQEYDDYVAFDSNYERIEGTYEYVYGYLDEEEMFNEYYNENKYSYDFAGKVKDFSKEADEPVEEETTEEDAAEEDETTEEEATEEGETTEEEATEEGETAEEEVTDEDETVEDVEE